VRFEISVVTVWEFVPSPRLPWLSQCTPCATGQQSLAYPEPVRLGDIAGVGFPKSDDSGSAPHLAFWPLVSSLFFERGCLQTV